MGSAHGWCPQRSYASARGAIERLPPPLLVPETTTTTTATTPIDSSSGSVFNVTNTTYENDTRLPQHVRRIDFAHCGAVRIQEQERWALNDTRNDTGLALWSASYVLAHDVEQMLHHHHAEESSLMVEDDEASSSSSKVRTTTEAASAGNHSDDGGYNNKDVVRGYNKMVEVDGNNRANTTRPWVCLELGAGLGLPSSMAVKCGLDVVATDYDDAVLALLEDNLNRNYYGTNATEAGGGVFSQPKPRVYKFDWDYLAMEASSSTPSTVDHHPVFRDLQQNGRRGVDVIFLSDVVYGATRPLWGSLLVILNQLRQQRLRLLVAGGNETNGENFNRLAVPRCDGTISENCDPLVLFAYTQRRRDMTATEEGKFFAMVKAAGMKAHLVPFNLIPHGEEFLLTSLYELRWS